MAGGSGTRLWPLSRRGEPKQLLRMIDGRSLLQLAFDRVRAVVASGTTGCLLVNADPERSVLAVTGLHDMAVVRTATATLVCPLSDSQRVKALVGEVKERYGAELA